MIAEDKFYHYFGIVLVLIVLICSIYGIKDYYTPKPKPQEPLVIDTIEAAIYRVNRIWPY
jgi:hypothetical protein